MSGQEKHPPRWISCLPDLAHAPPSKPSEIPVDRRRKYIARYKAGASSDGYVPIAYGPCAGRHSPRYKSCGPDLVPRYQVYVTRFRRRFCGDTTPSIPKVRLSMGMGTHPPPIVCASRGEFTALERSFRRFGTSRELQATRLQSVRGGSPMCV